jgi:hypothetical protein
VLLLPFPKDFFSWLFILASLVAGVIELLLPIRGPTFVLDGRRIWMLLWDRARGERWLALMKLIADARAGVLPESMSADLLARATAVRDESPDTVLAHAFAYGAEFHQHHDVDAGQMLEICLRYSSRAAPATREGLMSDSAVFQARRRNRPDLAEQWLAASPATRRTGGFDHGLRPPSARPEETSRVPWRNWLKWRQRSSRSPGTPSGIRSCACWRGGRPTCPVRAEGRVRRDDNRT